MLEIYAIYSYIIRKNYLLRLGRINSFPWFWAANLVNALKEDKTGVMF